MLEPLLLLASELNASDIHLSAGMPPMLRINGAMQALDQPVLGNAQVRGMIDSVLPETQRRLFGEGAACDFAFASATAGLGRYRANAYRQQRGVALALRPIPEKVPSLDSISAPAILKQLADTDHG
ncbi:MAG: hypothetical protein ACO29M_08270, partial [Fluviibacter sp.]